MLTKVFSETWYVLTSELCMFIMFIKISSRLADGRSHAWWPLEQLQCVGRKIKLVSLNLAARYPMAWTTWWNLPFGWARLLAAVQLIRGHLQLPRLRVPGRPFLYSPLRMILTGDTHRTVNLMPFATYHEAVWPLYTSVCVNRLIGAGLANPDFFIRHWMCNMSFVYLRIF